MRAPRNDRSSTPWLPPYRYTCDHGHEVQADRPVTRCPACPLGQPCEGALHQTAGKREPARA